MGKKWCDVRVGDVLTARKRRVSYYRITQGIGESKKKLSQMTRSRGIAKYSIKRREGSAQERHACATGRQISERVCNLPEALQEPNPI